MSYALSPNDPVIEPASDNPLPPGNYGRYQDRNLTVPGIVPLCGITEGMKDKSFEYNVTNMVDYENLMTLGHTAVHSYGRHCADVDRTTALGLGGSRGIRRYFFEPTAFIVAANASMLRKDLKVRFDNFAMDADDNYRIVVFRDLGAEQALLPTHLPRRRRILPPPPTLHHLCYTLCFMLLGGDFSETYSPGRVLSMMEELGVRGDER
ncbi:hypothetical protein C8R44DRAFT_866134 [Mycena epipterygia]|nr:hypothetical protein C8R44DRAFT_866134 [Mycena epipterygia]